MRCLFLLLFLLPSLAWSATSNVFTSPRDSVSLISAANTPGPLRLALHFHLTPGWHIYWSNPGDAGFPPRITLSPPATADDLAFPPPSLLEQGPVAAYVLSGDVILPFPATTTAQTITATAMWLVCSDICVPERANFTLPLTGGPSAEAALFPPTRIAPSPFAATFTPDGRLRIAGLTPTQVATARFFPDSQDAISNRAPQPLTFTPEGLILRLTPAVGFEPAQPLTGLLELTDPSGATQSLTLSATPGRLPGAPNLALWLAFAFLGGLILNLMPCVFPILAMKILALTRMNGNARTESLGYTAGVLTAMLVLASILLLFRATGAAIGWGFQFQSPLFVALLAWLILALALNLAGLYEIRLSLPFTRQGSFFTGLLSVALATPCTAPFMGGAIAAALVAPLPAAFGIFIALGLGLAAPFLLFAFLPGTARLLPRPGPWMRHLQRALSLPMFATFIWLAWVLTRQSGPSGLALLCLGALSLAAALAFKPLRPAALLAVLTLPFLHNTQAGAALTLPNAEPYSPSRLAALRAANTPVFIDLTAAWCVTCLVNEHTTLATPSVQSALTATHTQLLVGDWTNRTPEITQLLQENHRDGVPLYLYYPPGQAPKILPQLLTPQTVLAAIKP